MNGYYAFDLDGTLAVYDKWRGVDHIGKPIPDMVNRVKKLLAEGKDVRIFTARVWPIGIKQEVTGLYPQEYVQRTKEANIAMTYIVNWVLQTFGRDIPIQCWKDFAMLELYDDRAKQVIPNTGELIEEKLQEITDRLDDYKYGSQEINWMSHWDD